MAGHAPPPALPPAAPSVGQHAIDWWKEVWPFQWRIAISYACGFFIFQLFNPVLFSTGARPLPDAWACR
jgi:hypothetical protein